MPRPARAPLLLVLGLALVLAATPGCATITGLVSGAFTSIVDVPSELYHAQPEVYDEHGEYWPITILIITPVGIVLGPLAGFGKGIALDIDWLLDNVTYGDVFGSLKAESIWRPWRWHWNPPPPDPFDPGAPAEIESDVDED